MVSLVNPSTIVPIYELRPPIQQWRGMSIEKRLRFWRVLDLVLVPMAGFLGGWLWSLQLGTALVVAASLTLIWAWGYGAGRSDMLLALRKKGCTCVPRG